MMVVFCPNNADAKAHDVRPTRISIPMAALGTPQASSGSPIVQVTVSRPPVVCRILPPNAERCWMRQKLPYRSSPPSIIAPVLLLLG